MTLDLLGLPGLQKIKPQLMRGDPASNPDVPSSSPPSPPMQSDQPQKPPANPPFSLAPAGMAESAQKLADAQKRFKPQIAPITPTQPRNREEWLQSVAPTAQRYQQKYGMPAELALAMNASESNWGKAPTLFGMKGSGTAGSQAYDTWEMVNGQRVNTRASFAAYKNADDAYEHFFETVSKEPRYASAWKKAQAGDWQGFVRGINAAGYATDPKWADMILGIADGIKKGGLPAPAAEAMATVTDEQPPAPRIQPPQYQDERIDDPRAVAYLGAVPTEQREKYAADYLRDRKSTSQNGALQQLVTRMQRDAVIGVLEAEHAATESNGPSFADYSQKDKEAVAQAYIDKAGGFQQATKLIQQKYADIRDPNTFQTQLLTSIATMVALAPLGAALRASSIAARIPGTGIVAGALERPGAGVAKWAAENVGMDLAGNAAANVADDLGAPGWATQAAAMTPGLAYGAGRALTDVAAGRLKPRPWISGVVGDTAPSDLPRPASLRTSEPSPSRVPDLGDTGIKEALAAKQETTLTPGAIFGEHGSLQRRVIGAVNPAMDMPPEVHVANQARSSVAATMRTELGREELPAYRKLEATFDAEQPTYIGAADRPLAGTWVDYAENPSLYRASPALNEAKEELRAAQDRVIAAVRSQYGVDLKPWHGADPDGVYVPHMASRESLDDAVERTAQSLSSRGSVVKERAYDSLSDRAATQADFVPETDAGALADLHAAALARMAANNTFRAGAGGKTRIDVLNELHPGLRDALTKARDDVSRLRSRVESVTRTEAGAAAAGDASEAQRRLVDQRMAPLEARVEALGEEYGPELSHLSGQLRELRLQSARLEAAAARSNGRAGNAGLRLDALNGDLDAAQARVEELAKRYRTASTGDYVLNQHTYRFHKPDQSAAIDSVLKTKVNNAFIEGAIDAGNTARAAGLGPDFSPLTIQGALGAFSHPEVGITNAAGLVRAAFAAPESFARSLDPDLVRRFEFASGRSLGTWREEFIGETRFRLPGQPVKKFNDALQRVVDYGTLKAFENDSALLMRLGAMSQNVADAEAANALSKMIPRLNNADTGRSAQRVKLEGALPTSRSFTAAPFMLAKDFASALVKLPAGRQLLGREKLALVRGGSLIGTMFTASLASALISAEATGKDPAETVKDVLDPESPRFLSIVLGNAGSISIGGPFRSAFLGVYRATSPLAPGGKPAGSSIPAVFQYGRNRLQPIVGSAYDVAVNRDWKGDPIRTGSPWQQLTQAVEEIATNANLLAGSVVEGLGADGLAGAATGLASGLAGVNYRERSAAELRKQARDEATQRLYPGRKYGDLLTSEQEKVDADPKVARTIANAQEEYGRSDYSNKRDRRLAGFDAEQRQIEAAFQQGELSKPLPDLLRDLKARRYQTLQDLQDDFEDYFSKLPDRRHEESVDGFYDIEYRNADGTIDWDKTIGAREKYMARLPKAERDWIEDFLGVQQSKKSELQKQLDTYYDQREQLGYYDKSADTNALDKENPEIDALTWYFYGGVEGEPSPVLQSGQAAQLALAMNLPNRPVRLEGLARPLNGDDRATAAWAASRKPVESFLFRAVDANKEKEAARLYKKPYDRLTDDQKGAVASNIRTGLRKANPELDAWLVWWGYSNVLQSRAAGEQMIRIMDKYGSSPPKPGFSVRLAKNAR